MRLDSGAFLLVFAAFFAVYTCVPSRAKRWLLVLGSVAFYATLSARYVPLLLGLGALTFAVAHRLDRSDDDRARDRLLWLGVGVNVAALACFKLTALSPRWMTIGAPLGLSFYALQAVSCLVDVHRRVFTPPRSFVAFLASFTLFPHLLAGPIVRSSFLVPLVEEVDAVRWEKARYALALFLAGLVKKTVADRLAPIADLAFDSTTPLSAMSAWTGLLAYAGQLYADFSGYTDMATALALLLGLDLPANFDLPYLATSPADFWRRWHISLSTWLRDYVYLPLGVRMRRHRSTALVLTWMVAGLWHGFGWLYLLYGLYHGVLLALTDRLMRRFPQDEDPRGLQRLLQNVVTLYLVFVGYVIFRVHTFAALGRFLRALHAPRVASDLGAGALTTMGVCVAAMIFTHLLDAAVRALRGSDEPRWRRWIVWPAMALAVTVVALTSGTAHPFIYFAF